MSVSSGSALLNLLKNGNEATKVGDRAFLIPDDKVTVQVPISSIDLSSPSPLFNFSCGVASASDSGRRQVAVNRRFVVAAAADGHIRALDALDSDRPLGKVQLHLGPIVDLEIQPNLASMLLSTDGKHVAVTKLVKEDEAGGFTFNPVVLLAVGTEDDPVVGVCWLPQLSGVFGAWRQKDACLRLFDTPPQSL